MSLYFIYKFKLNKHCLIFLTRFIVTITEKIWSRGRELGSGCNGTVYLGSSNHPKHPIIAIKTSTSKTSLENEITILKEINDSDYVVRYLGNEVTLEKDGEITFNIFLEYAPGGTLEDLMADSETGRLPEHQVIEYTRMILRGLRDIHNKGYVHCDLKPSNILVFDGDHLKIADFGLSKKIKDYDRFDDELFRGTPIYMSPESVTEGENGPPLDIWSLGCIVVEMVTGNSLWDSSSDGLTRLYDEIAGCQELPVLPEDMSEIGKDFMKKCFDINYEKRWTAEMLLRHPFVAENNTVPCSSWSSFLPCSDIMDNLWNRLNLICTTIFSDK